MTPGVWFWAFCSVMAVMALLLVAMEVSLRRADRQLRQWREDDDQ